MSQIKQHGVSSWQGQPFRKDRLPKHFDNVVGWSGFHTLSKEDKFNPNATPCLSPDVYYSFTAFPDIGPHSYVLSREDGAHERRWTRH